MAFNTIACWKISYPHIWGKLLCLQLEDGACHWTFQSYHLFKPNDQGIIDWLESRAGPQPLRCSYRPILFSFHDGILHLENWSQSRRSHPVAWLVANTVLFTFPCLFWRSSKSAISFLLNAWSYCLRFWTLLVLDIIGGRLWSRYTINDDGWDVNIIVCGVYCRRRKK